MLAIFFESNKKYDLESAKMRFQKSAFFDNYSFKWAIDALSYLKEKRIDKSKLVKVLLSINNDEYKNKINIVSGNVLKCADMPEKSFLGNFVDESDIVYCLRDIKSCINMSSEESHSWLTVLSFLSFIIEKHFDGVLIESAFSSRDYIFKNEKDLVARREKFKHIPNYLLLKQKLLALINDNDNLFSSLIHLYSCSFANDDDQMLRDVFTLSSKNDIENLWKTLAKMYSLNENKIKTQRFSVPLMSMFDQNDILFEEQESKFIKQSSTATQLFALDFFLDNLIYELTNIKSFSVNNFETQFERKSAFLVNNSSLYQLKKILSKSSLAAVTMQHVLSRLDINKSIFENISSINRLLNDYIGIYNGAVYINQTWRSIEALERTIISDLEKQLYNASRVNNSELRSAICNLSIEESNIINRLLDIKLSQCSKTLQMINSIYKQSTISSDGSYQSMKDRLNKLSRFLQNIENEVLEKVSDIICDPCIKTLDESVQQLMVTDNFNNAFVEITNEYAKACIQNSPIYIYDNSMQLALHMTDKAIGQFWLSWIKNYTSRLEKNEKRLSEKIFMTSGAKTGEDCKEEQFNYKVANEIQRIVKMRGQYSGAAAEFVYAILGYKRHTAFSCAINKFYFALCFIKHISHLKDLLHGHSNMLDVKSLFRESVIESKKRALNNGINFVKRTAAGKAEKFFDYLKFLKFFGLSSMTSSFEQDAENGFFANENIETFLDRINRAVVESMQNDLSSINVRFREENENFHDDIMSFLLQKAKTNDIGRLAIELMYARLQYSDTGSDKKMLTDAQIAGLLHEIISSGEKAAITRVYEILKDDLRLVFKEVFEQINNSGLLTDKQLEEFIFNTEIDNAFRFASVKEKDVPDMNSDMNQQQMLQKILYIQENMAKSMSIATVQDSNKQISLTKNKDNNNNTSKNNLLDNKRAKDIDNKDNTDIEGDKE